MELSLCDQGLGSQTFRFYEITNLGKLFLEY